MLSFELLWAFEIPLDLLTRSSLFSFQTGLVSPTAT